jgi:hypothetical protein
MVSLTFSLDTTATVTQGALFHCKVIEGCEFVGHTEESIKALITNYPRHV